MCESVALFLLFLVNACASLFAAENTKHGIREPISLSSFFLSLQDWDTVEQQQKKCFIAFACHLLWLS